MRWRVVAIACLALAAAASCGKKSKDLYDPDIDRTFVAGVYDLTKLTFDPDGQAYGEYDILNIMPERDRPTLVVGRTDDTFQLNFRDPVTGLVQLVGGRYEITRSGIRLEFVSPADGQKLLLPMRTELEHDPDAGTLHHEDRVRVSFARLKQLVPELAGEPLADTIPGTLEVLFTLDRR